MIGNRLLTVLFYLTDVESLRDVELVPAKLSIFSLDFDDPLDITFTKLCKRGESNRILTKYSKCRYQSKNSHCRRLMPFKEEDIHSKPGIKIYHDVVYDSEIKKLILVTSKQESFLKTIGNRLLTALFYLTDVEYGGSTVFPMLNIVSPAEKGAALVFYNLDSSNGAKIIESLHRACPILKGNKWITTKWIREDGKSLPYSWKQNIPKKYRRI